MDLNFDNKLTEWLTENADEKYKAFNSRIVNSKKRQYGVRVPLLRAKAKELVKEFGNEVERLINPVLSLEHCTLYGLVIGQIKTDNSEFLRQLEIFADSCDSWAECDVAVSSMKRIAKDQNFFKTTAKRFIESKNEFKARIGYIILLDFYISRENVQFIFEMLDKDDCDCYYVLMAKAWLCSVCFVKLKDETFSFLKRWSTDKFTFNKTLQKICESYRVTDADKMIIKGMKK